MTNTYPTTFLLVTLTLLGTLITLSSINWLSVWLGFEINILGFLPLLLSSSSRSIEGAVNYLLVQASGSGLLLLSSINSWFSTGISFLEVESNATTIVLILSLLLNIGVFPFYFWVPSVINSTSWVNCLILITWQNLAPLALLCHLSLIDNEFSTLLALAIISILIGGILGVNQTQLRSLIAYSSVAHGGWITILTTLSLSATNVYFALYSLISWGLLSSLSTISQTTVLQSNSMENSSLEQITVNVSLLSLGGIPPLTGFFIKAIAIQEILTSNLVWVIILAILGALINLSYYLTLLFSLAVSYSPISSLMIAPSSNSSVFIVFNLIGIIAFPLALSLS